MLRYVPAVLGALLVVTGLAFIAWPLAIIALGGFLLLVDRRIS